MSDDYITLDTNFSIQSGFAFPSSAFVDEGIPIVRMSDLKTGSLKFENTKYVSSNWLDIASLFRLKEGDFVLGMSGSLSNHAKVTINDVPALLNQRVGRLVSKNLSNSYEYASYWLKSEFYQHYADIQGEGAAQKNISPKKIGAFKIRNVDKPTQDKIVYFLATVDRTIEKTEALIAKYQLIKAGLMQDLFTRGIGADGKLRPTREQAPELYQETQIGWIPKDWDLSHLKSMSKDSVQHLRTGPFGSALKGEHWREEGHPVITIGSLGEGEFNESELLYIGNRDVNRLIDFKLKLGDVVFSRVADVGRSIVIKDEQVGWIMSSNLMRISLDPKKMIADFLQYQLSSNDLIRRQIRCKVNAGGRDVANSEVLNSLWFIQPNYDEQLAIVKRAEKIEAKLKKERYLVRKLEQQKQGLMHDLLTGKKRVTVDECEADNV